MSSWRQESSFTLTLCWNGCGRIIPQQGIYLLWCHVEVDTNNLSFPFTMCYRWQSSEIRADSLNTYPFFGLQAVSTRLTQGTDWSDFSVACNVAFQERDRIPDMLLFSLYPVIFCFNVTLLYGLIFGSWLLCESHDFHFESPVCKNPVPCHTWSSWWMQA